MLTHPPRRNPEIQLTSFVDVLFNVLAFVLIVGSLDRTVPARLPVELPHPRMAVTSLQSGKELAVVLDRQGRLQVAGEFLTDEGFLSLLRASFADGRTVVIWADRRLAYERVVTILALVQESGSGERVRLAVAPR